jgi:hypothetical protein
MCIFKLLLDIDARESDDEEQLETVNVGVFYGVENVDEEVGKKVRLGRMKRMM